MKLVIVGQSWFGAEILKLCSARYWVVKVISPSKDDRLYNAATELQIATQVEQRIIKTEHIPPEVDLIIGAHAHTFISTGARLKTKYGAIGYHPSLLPRHRGRDAVRWTIHMRDSIAGGTVYWMDDGADTGAIAAQEFCHVLSDDTPNSLWRRELAPIGLRLMRQVIEQIAQGTIVAIPQDGRAATWEPAFNRPVLKAL